MPSQTIQTAQAHLAEAETTMTALRRQEVDAVIGDSQVLLLRLQEVEQALRESEQRLRELNKSLEQRVAERTAALEQQTQRLRQLANELTDTEQRERKRLAQMLHDGIQQILIGVEFKLALFAMDGEADDLAQAQTLLKEATQASRSLAYELAPPALYAANFHDALLWLGRRFDENHRFHVTINAANDLSVLDESAKIFLFNAIRELLLNSVKHSGVQQAVVYCTSGEDRFLQIEVCDAGQGFDPARLNMTADPERGFGLFSIRERLIALGGSLKIRSAPGAGACFVINYPISAPVMPRPLPHTSTPAATTNEPALAHGDEATQGLRILVVEDHHIVRKGLIAILQRKVGFAVVGEAEDGIEAIQLAEQLRPDVVLMDINLPRMDGIEATRQIRAMLPDTQVIGLSWHEEADMAQAMQQAGATAYLRKEAAAGTLLQTLQTLCANTYEHEPASILTQK